MCTGTAGAAAWLAPLVAVLPSAAYFALICFFMRRRAPREGMGELILRSLGRTLGAPVLLLIIAYCVCYCAYAARAGADRLVGTVYPSVPPAVFFVGLLIVAIPAAVGELTPLARMASVLRPVFVLLFILLFLFTLPGGDPGALLPVSRLDAVPVLKSSVSVTNVYSILAMSTFLMDRVEKSTKPNLPVLIGFGAAIAVLSTMTVALTIMSFGAELTSKLSYPFFVMVRNIRILDTIERIEAIVAGLWIAIDYVLVVVLLLVMTKLLCLVFTRLDRRIAALFCVAAVGVLGLFIPADFFSMQELRYFVVPTAGACVFFFIVPVSCLVGKLRRKI